MVKNPFIIIQARMNSERLPGKVLMKAGEAPLIGILFDRLKNSGLPILLATSENSENDPLEEYAREKGIMVYRGSEDNVLERYHEAAKQVNADLIFRLTGDNPFVEGDLIKEVFRFYRENNNPRTYISTGLSQTFPLGISVEAFGFNLLEEALLNTKTKGETEHVTPYMHQNMPGNITVVPFHFSKKRYHYRLTVDTERDFKLFKTLIEDYKAQHLEINEIIFILDNNPELSKINLGEKQKSWK
jgi:spore coat polysaccharide biosynthesis protein SpsF